MRDLVYTGDTYGGEALLIQPTEVGQVILCFEFVRRQ